MVAAPAVSRHEHGRVTVLGVKDALGQGPLEPVPTDDDKIAAITGGAGSDYAFANQGEPTGGGCMILFHVVRAGSLTPVTSGFQVFVVPS